MQPQDNLVKLLKELKNLETRVSATRTVYGLASHLRYEPGDVIIVKNTFGKLCARILARRRHGKMVELDVVEFTIGERPWITNDAKTIETELR